MIKDYELNRVYKGIFVNDADEEDQEDQDEDNQDQEDQGDTFLNQNYGKFISILGEGSFAKVFHYRKNKKDYAIKRIISEDNIPASLLIEATCLIRLYEYENIVKIIDVNTNYKGNYYIIMEYCPRDLSQIRDLTIGKIKKYARDLALCIKNTQDCNILHCDIKPNNILISKDNKLKLADFGMSKIGYCYSSEKEAFPFNLNYRAPEIVLGYKNYTDKVDSWCLGLLLYEFEHEAKFIDPSGESEYLFQIFSKLGTPSKQLYDSIASPEYARNYEDFPKYSKKILFSKYPELNDLLEHLLIIDPKERWSIEKVMSHPFINLKSEKISCINKIRKYDFVSENKHPKRALIIKNLIKKLGNIKYQYYKRDLVCTIQILDRYLENNKYKKGIDICCFILSVTMNNNDFEEEGEFIFIPSLLFKIIKSLNYNMCYTIPNDYIDISNEFKNDNEIYKAHKLALKLYKTGIVFDKNSEEIYDIVLGRINSS